MPRSIRFNPLRPPTAAKRNGFRIWFFLILLMEYGIGKKQLLTTRTFGSEEAAAVFTTLTRWQMLAHVLFDLFALYLLNSLHPMWGVRKPPRAIAPQLVVAPEHPVVARHSLKLLLRGALLATNLSSFEGYNLKQTMLMVLTPTIFAIAFVRMSYGSQLRLALVNACFVRVVATQVFHAYSNPGQENMLKVFLQDAGGLAVVDEVADQLVWLGIPAAIMVPFVSSRILWGTYTVG